MGQSQRDEKLINGFLGLELGLSANERQKGHLSEAKEMFENQTVLRVARLKNSQKSKMSH